MNDYMLLLLHVAFLLSDVFPFLQQFLIVLLKSEVGDREAMDILKRFSLRWCQ